jgi:hypothetical protein
MQAVIWADVFQGFMLFASGGYLPGHFAILYQWWCLKQ